MFSTWRNVSNQACASVAISDRGDGANRREFWHVVWGVRKESVSNNRSFAARASMRKASTRKASTRMRGTSPATRKDRAQRSFVVGLSKAAVCQLQWLVGMYCLPKGSKQLRVLSCLQSHSKRVDKIIKYRKSLPEVRGRHVSDTKSSHSCAAHPQTP